MVRVHFRPLRINKRSTRSIWNTHVKDEEKTGLQDDDYDDTSSESHSSRASSGSYGSHDAMLASSNHGAPPTANAFALQRQLRRKCNRYFTIVIGGILVLVVLTLVQLHFHSARQVEQHQNKPEPKPPWTEFPVLSRYYGGLRSLVTPAANRPEYPGDATETVEEVIEALENATATSSPMTVGKRQDGAATDLFKSRPVKLNTQPHEPAESIAECFIDEDLGLSVAPIHAYDGVPRAFPDSAIGVLHLNSSEGICLDRFSRLAPYGFGYSRKYGGTGAGLHGDREGADQILLHTSLVDYRQVRWAEAQSQCVRKNLHRFETSDERATTSITETKNGLMPRTAVLVRTRHDHDFTNDEILSLRALVTELTLATGGLFEVHFLIQVCDDNLQVWSDDKIYQQVLDGALPEEFRGMGTLWSEKQMSLVYGGLEETHHRDQLVHSRERGVFMPVQFFAHKHPEFDFVWNWDLDVRYTGHLANFLVDTSEWAFQQPRKEVWERNERFYVPAEHGSWEDFKQMVRVQSEHKTSESKGKAWERPGTHAAGDNGLPRVAKPVWGPENSPWDDFPSSGLAVAPTTQEKDKYTWGVSENADLITLNPIFDPPEIGFAQGSDVTGYNTSSGLPPRRATLGTVMRFSKRLLGTMHDETATHRRHMHSSMWPASVALHYGLKAVYVPHPVYVDRKWPTDYLAAVFNAQGEAGRASVFGESRRHNFRGLTWGYEGQFADTLWKRWLGFRVDDDGGEEAEMAGEGRMCLPPMLLGPVSRVELVIE